MFKHTNTIRGIGNRVRPLLPGTLHAATGASNIVINVRSMERSLCDSTPRIKVTGKYPSTRKEAALTAALSEMACGILQLDGCINDDDVMPVYGRASRS